MMIDTTKPYVIAICGNPGAGKTEFQNILRERFDVIPVDSGYPMRDVAMRHLGLTADQVYTQAGKESLVEFAGKEFEVRWFLGELGNKIEEMLGPWGIPAIAARRLQPGLFYSDASCRRDQGLFWKANANALIVEIENPLAKPSPHEFDRYDRFIVDVTIKNEALAWGYSKENARLDLERKADKLMLDYFGLKPRVLGVAA
jgi:hypothetical protein